MKEPTIEENKIAKTVLDACFVVHREMGPGLLESVYETCLCDILSTMNVQYERQKIIPVHFQGKKLDAGFRCDLIVEEKVLIEIKAIEKILPLHEAQLLNYLKLSHITIGLLLNFNTKLLKQGIRRLINSQNP